MTNVTNISQASRSKAVAAAIKSEPALSGKACLALDLLTDKSLADVPAAGIVAMLRGASSEQAAAATGRYSAMASGSHADSTAGWAKATAQANAKFGL